MNKLWRLLLSAMVLVGFGQQAFAQGGSVVSPNTVGRENVINTAVPFLRISPDARSGAMGDVGVALSPDASATYWNFSKLNFAQEDAGISISYTPWLTELVSDVFLSYLSVYLKIYIVHFVCGYICFFFCGC